MKKKYGLEDKGIFNEDELDEIFYGIKKSGIPGYRQIEIEEMAHRNKSMFVLYHHENCGHSRDARGQFELIFSEMQAKPLDNFLAKNKIEIATVDLETDPTARKSIEEPKDSPVLIFYNQGIPIKLRVKEHLATMYLRSIEEAWGSNIFDLESVLEFEKY
jgi:hypothetical protein